MLRVVVVVNIEMGCSFDNKQSGDGGRILKKNYICADKLWVSGARTSCVFRPLL
jgi:hypothetical protein